VLCTYVIINLLKMLYIVKLADEQFKFAACFLFKSHVPNNWSCRKNWILGVPKVDVVFKFDFFVLNKSRYKRLLSNFKARAFQLYFPALHTSNLNS